MVFIPYVAVDKFGIELNLLFVLWFKVSYNPSCSEAKNTT